MISLLLGSLLSQAKPIHQLIGPVIVRTIELQTDTILIFLLFLIVLLLGVVIAMIAHTLRTSPPSESRKLSASAVRTLHTPTGARRMAVSPDRAGFVRTMIEDTPTPPPVLRQYVTWPRTEGLIPNTQRAAVLIDRRNPHVRYDISWPIIYIGRAAGNTLQVSDLLVSRQHACLRQEPQGYCLFDLQSANGTYVNGQRVNRTCFLADGDMVTFGQTQFIFRQFA